MTHTTLAQTLTALETQGTPEALEILAIYHDSGEPTPEPTQGSGGEHSTQAQGFVLADTLEGILRGMSAMPSTLGHDTHTMAYNTQSLAHWKGTQARDDSGAPIGTRFVPAKHTASQAARIVAADKAAMPYLWNAKRQRTDLSSKRAYSAARKRMLATVVEA